MNIVIPMAGLGVRFANAGFDLPKPLIIVKDKPMYRWAVESLPLHLATELIFLLRENEHSQALIADIEEYFQGFPYRVVNLPVETRGQAETVLFSAPYIDWKKPTLIHNCDSAIAVDFSWNALEKQSMDGAILLFSSSEPRWSYAKLDAAQQTIIEFKEKKVISSHASTGTYFFNDSSLLFSMIEDLIQQNIRENNEFYLSSIYQKMIEANKTIIPLWCRSFLCFGTPQDLVSSLNILLTKSDD